MKGIERAALSDLFREKERKLIGNMALNSGALAINDTAAATFKTTATINYLANGIFKAKTAFTAQAFSEGHTALAIGQTGYFVVCLTSGGTVSTVQGVGALPAISDDLTAIGIIKVVAGAEFTPGTTALDAADIVTTYHNICMMPTTAP